MKTFYQDINSYKAAHKQAFSGQIFCSKPIVTVALPDLLAEVQVTMAGFTSAALVRYLSAENIGKTFESIESALKDDAGYMWFKNSLATTCRVSSEQLSLSDFIKISYGHEIVDSLSYALTMIDALSKKNKIDFVKFYDKNHKSIFTNPSENIILRDV